MMTKRRLLIVLALLGAPVVVIASDLEPNGVLAAGLQVTQLIDKGQISDTYAGASIIMRGAVSKESFVTATTKARTALGAVATRLWVRVARNAAPGSTTLPAGNYISAEFETTFASKKVVHELVSFHLDTDNTWRLAGYAVE